MNNVFILVISGRLKEWGEKDLLSGEEDWKTCTILSDGITYKSFNVGQFEESASDRIPAIDSYCFSLVCEETWKQSPAIRNYFRAASEKYDCMYILIHNGGAIDSDEFKSYKKEPKKIPFSHVSNFNTLNIFMQTLINKNSNIETFNRLVNFCQSLKSTPNLLALSILCQGYLVANSLGHLCGCDDIKQAESLSQALTHKDKVNNIEWWRTVFGNSRNLEVTVKDEWGNILPNKYTHSDNKKLADLIKRIQSREHKALETNNIEKAYKSIVKRLILTL